jgi:hypothetical protein
VLCSQREEDLAFCGAIAASGGLTLRRVNHLAEVVQVLKEGSRSVFFVEVLGPETLSSLEQIVQSEVGLFSELVNGNFFHFISDADFEECPWLAESPLMGSFILRNFPDPQAAGERYGRLVAASLKERAFGLAQLLGPSAKVQKISLARSTQKQEAVEEVQRRFGCNEH